MDELPDPGGLPGPLDLAGAGRILDAIEGHDHAHDTGPRIDGYQVLGRLGEGGAAEVYLVRRGSERPLALKLLRQRMGDGRDARRAWRELDILEGLRHAAIPRLLGYGLHDDRLYLTTEYIEGMRLEDYGAAHRLERRARVELLAAVADAVQALHEHGVLHRDLKPSNVLVDDTGRPVLIDLGIATLLDGDPGETITREGLPLGSPAFMAPEQARGERESISTRTDVYALGATACLMLTGDMPHGSEAPVHEMIRRVAGEPARDPRVLDPSLPKPLAAVLRKSLAADPADRYPSAAAFAEDLRRWLRRDPVEAGKASLVQRLARAAARRPAMSLTAFLLILGALVVAVSIVAGSAAVTRWRNRQPAFVDHKSETLAVLRAYSGAMIREWHVDPPRRITLAVLVRRSPDHGDVVVIGIGHGHGYDPESQLHVYDATDPEVPLWSSGTEFDMPDPISRVGDESFVLARAALVDVFPDPPGREIVACHAHPVWSPNVLRVYSLDGEILYQVWHDGAIGTTWWVPESGQLVSSGLNSENDWSGRRDVEVVREQRYPWVVFAVEPRLHEVHDAWIHTPGGLGTVEPAWYRCVLPHHVLDRVPATAWAHGISRPRDHVANAGDDRVILTIIADHKTLIEFVLDRAGDVTARYSTSHYERARRTWGLPPAEAIHVGELPKLVVDPLDPP